VTQNGGTAANMEIDVGNGLESDWARKNGKNDQNYNF